ncbi:MAG: rubrerythrin family protein [Kiritimatiellae bacterium]|nr:rubrerythrin family protein [Kiritimatiellia bacterium]
MKHLIAGITVAMAAFCFQLTSAQADEAADAVIANLQKSHSGELNANVRYLAFAVKADEEGYKSVAALFRAAADSEAIHAQKFAETITKLGAVPKSEMEKPTVKSTRENLEAALQGETAEKDTLYPGFAKQADGAKQAMAAMFFRSAMAAETEHAKFYKQALDKMDVWKAAGKEFAVCQVCGYTVMGAPPLKCVVCASPREKFKVIK